MCKLPENSTILGYGLSYESDLTRCLSNSELQQKIEEYYKPRIQSPPGVYRCVVCGGPVTPDDKNEPRSVHSECSKSMNYIIHIVASSFNLKVNGLPIDISRKFSISRSASCRADQLTLLGVEDLDTLLAHPLYGRFAAVQYVRYLNWVLKHRLARQNDSEESTAPVSDAELMSVVSSKSSNTPKLSTKLTSKCSSSKNPTKNQKSSSKSNSICKALDKKGANPLFQGITSRELIDELKSRGYKWDAIWVEEVEVKRRYVKM